MNSFSRYDSKKFCGNQDTTIKPGSPNDLDAFLQMALKQGHMAICQELDISGTLQNLRNKKQNPSTD